MGIDKHAYNPFGEELRDEEHHHAAHHRRPQGQAEGRPHPLGLCRSVVVAQDGLCRLGDGIVYHKDDGEEVAGDAEGRHAVLAQVADEDVIAHEHHGSDGRFAQEGGEAQAHHVAYVAHRQPQALQAQLDALQADDVPALQEVEENHQRPEDVAQAGGQCGAEHTPLENVDEQPVEEDVDERGHDVAGHGIVGRAVEPHEEHARAEQRAEHQEGYEPVHVFYGQREQPFAAAQQAGHLLHIAQDGRGIGNEQQGRDDDGLRYVDACHLRLAVRQMDGCHDRRPDTEHQRHARIDEEQRSGDVDRRQRVATDAFAHKDAVRNDEDGRKHHAQHGGYQQLPEQGGDVHAAEVDAVFQRSVIVFFRCHSFFVFAGAKVSQSSARKINK